MLERANVNSRRAVRLSFLLFFGFPFFFPLPLLYRITQADCEPGAYFVPPQKVREECGESHPRKTRWFFMGISKSNEGMPRVKWQDSKKKKDNPRERRREHKNSRKEKEKGSAYRGDLMEKRL